MSSATENSWKFETEIALNGLIKDLKNGGSNNTLALSFRLSDESKHYLSTCTLKQGYTATWTHIEEIGDSCTLTKL